MSKQSYKDGFCKASMANGVDPKLLAAYAVEKAAQDSGSAAGDKSGFWESLMDMINRASVKGHQIAEDTKTWYGGAHPALKALIGAGIGSAAGTGLAAAVKGKKGLRAGSILGALAGAGASQVDWHALAEHFGQIKNEDSKKQDHPKLPKV